MTKVKWDVTGSDPDEAVRVTGASPQPGRYRARIETCEQAESKSGAGPMLAVTMTIVDADKKSNRVFKGSTLWYYPLLPGHGSYEGFPKQKTDQFLLAVGVATKSKRKGTLDTDDIVGVDVIVVVRAGKNLDGDYRGEVASVHAFDEDIWEERKESERGSGGVDDSLPDLEEVEEEDTEEEEPEEEMPDDYAEWKLADLREEAEARDLDATGSKAKLIKLLEADDEDDGEEEEDEEEEEEPEEEPAPRKTSAKTASRKPTSKAVARRRKGAEDFPFE